MFTYLGKYLLKYVDFCNSLNSEYLMENCSENSFLQETKRISNVNSCLRREIDYRFSISKVNRLYKFPRSPLNFKNASKSKYLNLKLNLSKRFLMLSLAKPKSYSRLPKLSNSPTKSSILQKAQNSTKLIRNISLIKKIPSSTQLIKSISFKKTQNSSQFIKNETKDSKTRKISALN